jgi:uncharacterized protein
LRRRNTPSFSLDSLTPSDYIFTAFLQKTVEFLRKNGIFGHLTLSFFQRCAPEIGGKEVSVLRINISKLSEGAHHHSLQATPAEIGLDSRFTKEVNVEATLDKSSRQLYLRVDFKTGGVFTCDRCLEEFEREISSGYSLVYVTDGRAGGGDDEVQVISPDSNFIDLGEDVRQFAVLALPQKTLCREDCAGLCPTCGTNLNRTKCSCQLDQADSSFSSLRKIIRN